MHRELFYFEMTTLQYEIRKRRQRRREQERNGGQLLASEVRYIRVRAAGHRENREGFVGRF